MEVTRLRSQWGEAKNVDEKMRTANQIEGMLSKLLIVQERYPKLKADRSFQNIMKSIGWFVDSIDTTTRYMVASEFGKSRDEKSIKKVLGKAKNKSENKFEIITTDGFTGYDKSVKNVFGYYHFQRGNKTHKVVTQLKNEGFNIKIERMHNSIRHRIKTFRGFHGGVDSANAIMKGYEIYYNFIRNHLALGKTPSELATDIMRIYLLFNLLLKIKTNVLKAVT